LGTKLNAFLATEHDSATGMHGLASGLVTDVVNIQTLSAPLMSFLRQQLPEFMI